MSSSYYQRHFSHLLGVECKGEKLICFVTCYDPEMTTIMEAKSSAIHHTAGICAGEEQSRVYSTRENNQDIFHWRSEGVWWWRWEDCRFCVVAMRTGVIVAQRSPGVTRVIRTRPAELGAHHNQ
ncbi:hypothetical protein BHE74_00044081, partial [Ensete ventricosum]